MKQLLVAISFMILGVNALADECTPTDCSGKRCWDSCIPRYGFSQCVGSDNMCGSYKDRDTSSCWSYCIPIYGYNQCVNMCHHSTSCSSDSCYDQCRKVNSSDSQCHHDCDR